MHAFALWHAAKWIVQLCSLWELATTNVIVYSRLVHVLAGHATVMCHTQSLCLAHHIHLICLA